MMDLNPFKTFRAQWPDPIKWRDLPPGSYVIEDLTLCTSRRYGETMLLVLQTLGGPGFFRVWAPSRMVPRLKSGTAFRVDNYGSRMMSNGHTIFDFRVYP